MKIPPTDHRPWALPAARPAMSMVWHDLLFMHWPIPADQMAAVLPKPFRPDTFDGVAWIGVVPFRMSGVAAWGLPGIPGTSAFCELNVRTYVTIDGKPGVYFFSLDAANWLAVRVARRVFHLPYMDARMTLRRSGDTIDYASTRTHRGEPPAEFKARYRPIGPAFEAGPGSLEHFLTERYCLYARAPDGRVFRGDIHHSRWPLRPAEAEVDSNTMARAAGITLPDHAPHLLYADRLEVPAWWPALVPPA